MLDTQQVEQTTTKPVTKTRKTRAKETKPRKERKERGGVSTVRSTARRLVVRNPSISVEELQTALTKQGFKPTKLVVAGHRNSVRDILRIIQQEGLKEIKL